MNPEGVRMLHTRAIPGVTIRRGTPEDAASVLKLSKDVNYMDGGDYAPGTWHLMVSDPRWQVVVAEKNGEVVSMYCSRFVRGGIQGAAIGGRNHPSVRSQGVFTAMKEYVFRWTATEYPHVRNVFGSTSHIKFFEDAKDEESDQWNFSDVGRRYRWIKKARIDDITTAISRLQSMGVTVNNIRVIQEPELKTIFGNEEVCRELFPDNHFQMGPQVYEVHEDVTEVVFTSFGRKVYVNEENSSLSMVSSFACPVGTAVYVDIYGTVETSDVLQQILKCLLQVPEAHSTHGGGVFFRFGLQRSLDVQRINQIVWNRPQPLNEHELQEMMMHSYDMRSFVKKYRAGGKL